MEITLIVPQNFYIFNENAAPPLQFEPFYNYGDIDFIHLKRGDSLNIIPEAELYGISAYTVDIKMADIIARFLKNRDDKCKVVIGGSHATYRSNEIDDIYDYVVVGNGEDFISSVIDGRLSNKRIHVSDNRNMSFNQRSFRHFAPYNPNYHRGSVASYSLRTSYGCYWNCNFCAQLNSRVLFRDVDEIENQLLFLHKHGVRNLRVIDEIFTEHPKLEIICQLFESFEWVVQTRIDRLTNDKAEVMGKYGCSTVQVGLESFSSEVRDKLNKRLPDNKLRDGIKAARDNGLKLYCYIMLGTPFDTYDTIRQTVDIGRELLNGDELRPDIFCPLPGTAIGDNPDRYNLRMLTSNYEYYSVLCFQNTHGQLVSVPKHIKDVQRWEKTLRDVLYELNTPVIQNVLDNPITDWHDNYRYCA